jgi:hypothetical protein
MTSLEYKQERTTADQIILNEMTQYGITRVPVEYFHYKGFRYSNLLDAIAQAKRETGQTGSKRNNNCSIVSRELLRNPKVSAFE